MTLVILNGYTLAPGHDYEWDERSPSHTIRFTRPLAIADVVQFIHLGQNPHREVHEVVEPTAAGRPPVWI